MLDSPTEGLASACSALRHEICKGVVHLRYVRKSYGNSIRVSASGWAKPQALVLLGHVAPLRDMAQLW